LSRGCRACGGDLIGNRCRFARKILQKGHGFGLAGLSIEGKTYGKACEAAGAGVSIDPKGVREGAWALGVHATAREPARAHGLGPADACASATWHCPTPRSQY
jgi:hypothetical protein